MIKNIHTSKETSKRWYEANKGTPEFEAKRKARLLKWRRENPQKYLWQRALRRAALTFMPFEIDYQDIIIPDKCPVFNVPFEYGTPYAASLDRIDNSKGYLKDNIQVISRRANLMKQNASQDELRNFAQWALKTYSLS